MTTVTPHALVTLFQGDDRLLRFTIVNLSDVSEVSGAEWDLYVRHTEASLLPKTLGAGIALEPTLNTVDVSLSEAETAALVPTLYDDQLRVSYVSGQSEIVAQGLILVNDRHVGE